MPHPFVRPVVAGAVGLLFATAIAAPLAAPAASAPRAGTSCRTSDLGKVTGGLTCRRTSGGTRWVAVATTSTAGKGATAKGGATSTTKSTATTAATAADAGTPKRGGKLVFANTTEPQSGFTPQLATLGTANQMIRALMIETLTQPDLDGNIACWLCASITPNSTFTDWTIKLRPGISFHDGTPLDANALKLNLDEGRKPSSATASTLRSITAVDVVDTLTVRVRLDGPWVSFPANLTQQAGAIVAPSQLRDPDGRRNPVGTGPFKIKDFVLGDRVTVVRNDNYWRKGLPYLDEITFRPITEEGPRVTALQAGEVDAVLTSTGQTISQLRELAKSGKSRLIEATRFPSINNIALNNATGPTADVRIRRALQLATDRALINKIVQADTAKLANSPFGRATIDTTRTFWPSVDVAKAKALVDQVVQQTGKPVEITLSAPTGSDSVGQAELLQSMWRAIGITVKIQIVDSTGLGNTLQRGSFQAIIAGPLLSSVDPDEMRRYFYSDGVPVGQLSSNWTRTSSGIIDAAFDQIRTNSDDTVRARAAEAIDREIADQAYTLLTTEATWATATSNRIAFARPTLPDGGSWWPFPTGVPPLAFAYRQ